MMDTARGVPARALLREHAIRDFDRDLAHLMGHVREDQPGFIARALSHMVTSTIAGLGLRRRLDADVDLLMDLGREVRAGADPDEVARRHARAMLRLKEAALFIRVNDPAFAVIEREAKALLARRLPDLARLDEVDGARDFGDLVTRAWPDRAHIDALVQDNVATIHRLVDHVVAHPHLLRVIPNAWVPRAARVARRFLQWKVEDLERELDGYYSG